MSDLAPWESGHSADRPAQKKPARPGTAQYQLPSDKQLAEVYKPESSAFIAPAGRVVPRPPMPVRPLEPRAKMAFMVLGGVEGVALLGTALVFVILGADSGTIRLVYAGLGGSVALVALAVIALEYPRLNTYRNTSFMPGVLVYGSRAQMEKVAGPAGVGTIQMQSARGTGTGLLNKVFDRSAKLASPPEVVALHCDRGNGPEFVGIEWDAVRELQRGDVVWFHMKSPYVFLMFHKMVPFAPTIQTDKATRDEVFKALKVGSNMYIDRPSQQAMGKTKVFQTDADGNIVASAGRPGPMSAPDAPDVPLADLGSFSTDDQYYQGAPGEVQGGEIKPGRTGKTHLYNIGESGKPLGGHEYDPGDDDQQ